MKKYSFFFLALLVGLVSCKPSTSNDRFPLSSLQWLEGSWISSDSISIETWAMQDGVLAGNSFSSKEGRVTETLKISDDSENFIFEAKVINQNNDQPIQFTLENQNPDSLLFVNESHDFPQYVIYHKTSDTTLYCRVYSKENKGYEFIFSKLKDK